MSPSLESAMLALSLTYWPFFTRIVYAETRALSASLFVEACAASAPAPPRSCSCISCPTPLRPVIVRATIGLGFTILVAARAGLPRHGRHAARTGLGPRASPRAAPILPAPGGTPPSPAGHPDHVMGFNLLGDGLARHRRSPPEALRDDPALLTSREPQRCRSAPTRASRQVLDDVASTWSAGRILGVVGESGCGKST
jgi:ABC-type multidrug transport system fused ATPase/permease subunit